MPIKNVRTICMISLISKALNKINMKPIENKSFAELTKKRIRTEVSFKSEKDKTKFIKHLAEIKKQLKIK